MSIPAWLAPGSTIKRWLIVFASGVLVLVLGISFLLVDLYRKAHFPPSWQPAINVLTLQNISRWERSVFVMVFGVGAVVVSLRHLDKVISTVITHPMRQASKPRGNVVDAVRSHKVLQRGPRIVAIGGGTGMSKLLHGLRTYSGNLSVVVTVADDGGSSGRLRRELRILPPGDFRQCIAAMADLEDVMARLLDHRFSKGSGLEGHAFGNLFIAAMAEVTGSFEKALAETSRVLAVRGQILPSTLDHVTLAAELRDQSTLEGESKVGKGTAPIERVFLMPDSPKANPDALEAIREADVIVVGPGSLYTSIMPNLLVPGIAQAIADSRASLKVFVCNVATEPGETDGYTAVDFVKAVERHVHLQLFDYVITNNNHRANKPEIWKSQMVKPGDTQRLGSRPQIKEADVVNNANALQHDPQKLAQLLLHLYDGKHRTPERPSGGLRMRAFNRDDMVDAVPSREDALVAGRR